MKPILTNFLKLNENVVIHDYDLNAFVVAIGKTYIRDCKILCEKINPETIKAKKLQGKHFTNVSFLGKEFRDITFRDCEFEGCIFSYALFVRCEFHDCTFFDCNFGKARFERVYGKPSQFHRANLRKQYANIAVDFYRALLDNYSNESQRDFRLESDYHFRRWRRIHTWNESTGKYHYRKKKPLWDWLIPCFWMWIQEKFFGYGWKIIPMFCTVCGTIVLLTLLNWHYAQSMFQSPPKMGFFKALYFTFTTMSTLGASGFEPNTNHGYAIVMLDVGLGLFLLTNVVSAAFKRLVP